MPLSASRMRRWSSLLTPIGPRASASVTATPRRRKTSRITSTGARLPKSIIVPAQSKMAALSGLWVLSFIGSLPSLDHALGRAERHGHARAAEARDDLHAGERIGLEPRPFGVF